MGNYRSITIEQMHNIMISVINIHYCDLFQMFRQCGIFWSFILMNAPSVDVSFGITLSNIEVHILYVLIKRMKFETNTYVICVSVWSIPYCTFCFLNCLFTYINDVLIQPYFKAKYELMIYIEECSL